MRQAQPLDAYLDSADALARLAAHAERLLKLQRVLLEVAPRNLADACRVANFKLGKVILHANSGAVAAKLNQILPSLADEFFKKGCEVTEICVKVQPNNAAAQHPSPRVAPAVGSRTKAELTRLAAALPDGSELREALERLVRRGR
jgi:hypothetical protein